MSLKKYKLLVPIHIKSYHNSTPLFYAHRELLILVVNYFIALLALFIFACHITEKKKGVRRIDLSLFGKPSVNSDNAEIWNEVLKELAEACNKNINQDLKRTKKNGRESNIQSAHVTSEIDKFCGTTDKVFVGGLKKG